MIFHILRSSAGSCYLVEEGKTNRFDIGATPIGIVNLDVQPIRKKVIKYQWVMQHKDGSLAITSHWYSHPDDYRLKDRVSFSLGTRLLLSINETAKEMYEDEH